jgi:hypothetical protein
MITTTLKKIAEHGPCWEGWRKLLEGLAKTRADDELLPLVRILEISGVEDALWALRASDATPAQMRMLAVRFARRVQHLMTDARSVAALDVAEIHARGEATDEELVEARAAADAARAAAGAAAGAAADAARAAARAAAGAAAGAAAWYAAWAAAWYAAWAAAWAAADAAWAEAWAEARAAERQWQAQEFRRWCEEP